MQITDIKIRKLFDDGPMKAIASVTFDGQLAVHDIKVINARDKFFIVMPSRKNDDGTYLVALDVTGFGNEMMLVLGDYGCNEAYFDLTYSGENEPAVDTSALYAYRIYCVFFGCRRPDFSTFQCLYCSYAHLPSFIDGKVFRCFRRQCNYNCAQISYPSNLPFS